MADAPSLSLSPFVSLRFTDQRPTFFLFPRSPPFLLHPCAATASAGPAAGPFAAPLAGPPAGSRTSVQGDPIKRPRTRTFRTTFDSIRLSVTLVNLTDRSILFPTDGNEPILACLVNERNCRGRTFRSSFFPHDLTIVPRSDRPMET